MTGFEPVISPTPGQGALPIKLHDYNESSIPKDRSHRGKSLTTDLVVRIGLEPILYCKLKHPYI